MRIVSLKSDVLIVMVYILVYTIYKEVSQASERFFGRVTITRIIIIVSQSFVVSYSLGPEYAN